MSVDHPIFEPHLTPAEMLERGVFGGAYFGRATEEDFDGLDPDTRRLARQNVRTTRSRALNAYEVFSGMSYLEWYERGWIFPEDPLGWFHWYCRYHAGRRHERDGHQIGRWFRYADRWSTAYRWTTVEPHSPVVKQGLLQWAYEPLKLLDKQGYL